MTGQPKILIIEDDPEIRNLVRDFLNRNGFRADVGDGGAAMDRFIASFGEPDLIVLDLMLPGEDGLAICARLRATSSIPIIMLTARADEIDRIVGLEIGADDYLAKPFNPRELVARIRAVLRRQSIQQLAIQQLAPKALAQRRLAVGHLVIDLDARSVHREDDTNVDLTAAEFDLLECFVTRPNRVLSRDQLMDWTRGRRSEAFDRTIDVQMSRLRKKIQVDGDHVDGDRAIKTIRNQGYILTLKVKEI